jgi:hypothetical protein
MKYLLLALALLGVVIGTRVQTQLKKLETGIVRASDFVPIPPPR